MLPAFADGFIYPVANGYKQRDHIPYDSYVRGDYYRSNWIDHSYNLLGKILSIHEGDDILRWEYNCYGDPVFSIANGIVTFSADVGAPKYPGARPSSTWRNYIVIEHRLLGGVSYYSKYAHLKDRLVAVGDIVTIGQLIGHIGDASGAFPGAAHLHFALCVTDLLKRDPTNWPSTGHDAKQAKIIIDSNYTDPLKFIRQNLSTVPVKESPVTFTDKYVDTGVDRSNLMLRSQPVKPPLNDNIISKIAYGAKVSASDLVDNTYRFVKVNGLYGWMANEYLKDTAPV